MRKGREIKTRLSKTAQARLKKKKEEADRLDDLRRYQKKNVKAMSFCIKHGYTIYASGVFWNRNIVKLFCQRGSKFIPLNEIEYDQSDKNDVIKYCAAIDRKYEKMYLKMKDKV